MTNLLDFVFIKP